MKKIIISILCVFLFIGGVFSAPNDDQTSLGEKMGKMTPEQLEQFKGTEISDGNGGTTTVGQALSDGYFTDGITGARTEAALSAADSALSSGGNKSKSCATSDDKNNLCSPIFEIKVNTFSPGGKKFVGNGISSFFVILIGNLMIGLGVIALLIMSVGAGYMIFYHGQDEYLSKGKSIFMAGIIALVVALSSYFLVNLLRFILYS